MGNIKEKWKKITDSYQVDYITLKWVAPTPAADKFHFAYKLYHNTSRNI